MSQLMTLTVGGVRKLLYSPEYGGVATSTDCCCPNECCDDEVISRYEREGVTPTTTAECGTVMRAEIIAQSGGCVTVGDFILLYEDSPFIWSNRPDDPLNNVGFLSAACSEIDGFGNSIAGCPSSNNEGIRVLQECNPFRFVVEYEVGPVDLVCFGCPVSGGTFTIEFTLERQYGDPC